MRRLIKVAAIREESRSNVGKTDVEEKRGDVKYGDREFKKVQCPVCDESHDLDNCSMIKDELLEERSKILWKKSCAVDDIHQYHKITMQKHVNREEHA